VRSRATIDSQDFPIAPELYVPCIPARLQFFNRLIQGRTPPKIPVHNYGSPSVADLRLSLTRL
jgi:hypothetical protein